MKTYEVLEKALALIEDESRWWQGYYCNGAADRFCALGAINVAQGLDPDDESLVGKSHRLGFCRFVKKATGQMAAEFNDRHSHADVVALFKRAIRREKAKASAAVAQEEERLTCNQECPGSTPGGGSEDCNHCSCVTHEGAACCECEYAPKPERKAAA